MILNFEGEHGARRFEFVFVGFVLGGSLQEKKGMQILRTEVGLFEKLEAISEPMPCGKTLVNGEAKRQLVNGGASQQLQITLPEYDLLFNYVQQVPWQAGTPAKHALDTLDWLAATHRASRAS